MGSQMPCCKEWPALFSLRYAGCTVHAPYDHTPKEGCTMKASVSGFFCYFEAKARAVVEDSLTASDKFIKKKCSDDGETSNESVAPTHFM